MQVGKLSVDSLGQHPRAKRSWVGCARTEAFDTTFIVQTEMGEEPLERMEALMVSVSESLHDAIVQSTRIPHVNATFLPWGDSGVGLLTLSAAGHGHVTVMDVAGRTDLRHLQAADAVGRTCVLPVSDACPEITPWLPVRGLSEALTEASGHRRLAAQEFVAATENLRGLLRSPAVYPMLGVEEQEFESLTLCVCQPV